MKNTLTPYIPEEKKDSSIIVLYGTPDSGKSTLALTLTKDYKTAYFDIERMALDRLVDMPSENVNAGNLFDMGVINSLEEVLKFIESPLAQQVDVVVIDSITHLLNKVTAHANPAALKGNAVFGFYRDLGRNAIFICEKAREKKVNLVITAQAVKDKKGYENVFVPDVVGNETPSTLRDLSDVMVFVEKNEYRKRTIWLDTDNSFCLTKSKGLDSNHPEKVAIEGLDEFAMQTILGDKKLYIKPAPKKLTKKQIKELEDAIKESNKVKEFEIENLFAALGIEQREFKDLFEAEFKKMIGAVKARTEKQKKLAEIKKQTQK